MHAQLVSMWSHRMTAVSVQHVPRQPCLIECSAASGAGTCWVDRWCARACTSRYDSCEYRHNRKTRPKDVAPQSSQSPPHHHKPHPRQPLLHTTNASRQTALPATKLSPKGTEKGALNLQDMRMTDHEKVYQVEWGLIMYLSPPVKWFFSTTNHVVWETVVRGRVIAMRLSAHPPAAERCAQSLSHLFSYRLSCLPANDC